MAIFDDRGSVPEYYSRHGIRHWSNTKVRCPLAYLIAEYSYRQPRFYEAKRQAAEGDAEAEKRMRHYAKPRSIQMAAGTAVHEAAFDLANGRESSDHGDYYKTALEQLSQHKPADHNDRDQRITKHLMAENGEKVTATIEQAVAGIREAFVGANQIETEERIDLELPGIDVPIVGYADGRGAGIIGELKTRWDRINNRAKSGFAVNSVPNRPEPADIAQIALYQRGLERGATTKIIYANARGYVVHEIQQDQLDEAMAMTCVTLRKRQRIFERCDDLRQIIDLCEPDWSDFRWRDFSPALLGELKELFA